MVCCNSFAGSTRFAVGEGVAAVDRGNAAADKLLVDSCNAVVAAVVDNALGAFDPVDIGHCLFGRLVTAFEVIRCLERPFCPFRDCTSCHPPWDHSNRTTLSKRY